jgi:hypothetical protein
MKRIIGGVLLAMAASAHAQVGNPGGAINDRLGDVDYGVCRGVDPQCYHDWPRAAVKQYRVLLYTHTAGPRHANLGAPLAAGLNPALGADNVAQREMVRIAGEQGWAIDYTEDPKEMVNLSGYNAVIFLSTSREALDDNGKTALRQYMRAGAVSWRSTMPSGRCITGRITRGCWAMPISLTMGPRATGMWWWSMARMPRRPACPRGGGSMMSGTI